MTRLLHSHERLKDNTVDHVLGLMTRAGFAEVKNVGQRGMLFGRIAYYAAVVPAS